MLQPQLQGIELNQAERTFDPEHQLVVHSIEVVKIVRIADQGVKDLTQLQQVAPVFVGARQPRKLPAEHETDFTEGDTGEQLFEASARLRADGGTHA